MATIKSFTSLEQSRKLAEILPLESADMHYGEYCAGGEDYPIPNCDDDYNGHCCWSLAALQGVLPDEITDDVDVYRNMFFHLKGKYIIQYSRLTTLWPSLLSVEADNPVDACYEMILKLHKQNLI